MHCGNIGYNIIDSVSQKLILTVPLQVPELVYMHLNSMEQHETLLGSSHFTNYVHFLISKKLLDSLLIKTLQVNRYITTPYSRIPWYGVVLQLL